MTSAPTEPRRVHGPNAPIRARRSQTSTVAQSFYGTCVEQSSLDPCRGRGHRDGRDSPPPAAGSHHRRLKWGAMNGARDTTPVNVRPATECTAVAAKHSRSVNGGRIPGRRAVIMDFPDPGGPIINMSWPPAAAISAASRASGWPTTSARLASKPPTGRCRSSEQTCSTSTLSRHSRSKTPATLRGDELRRLDPATTSGIVPGAIRLSAKASWMMAIPGRESRQSSMANRTSGGRAIVSLRTPPCP